MISNSEIALRAAAGGAVLLKNRGNVLPFAAGKQIALLGRDCFDYIKCGGGSACVLSEYEISVAQGLINEQRSGHIKISPLSLECDKNEYTPEILKKIGEECTEVIIAAKAGDKRDTIYEIADLAYHTMVMMVEMGITVDDVRKELSSRHVIDHKIKQEKMT